MVATAALLAAAPLAAQAPDQGGKVPGGGSGGGSAGGSAVVPAAPSRNPVPGYRPESPARATQPGIRGPGAPNDRVEKTAKESIAALDLQTSLVEKTTKDSIEALDLQTNLGDRARRQPIAVKPISVPEWLLWTALAGAGALLLYALRDELMKLVRRRDRGFEPVAASTVQVAADRPADALATADDLSRAGNFAEAMHVLLLYSVGEIRRRIGQRFADSLTSREILRAARLDSAGRAALREIVAAVERTYFGAYPAAAADYAACRRQFETLQQGLRGGAPA
jgi:hypothetical protein